MKRYKNKIATIYSTQVEYNLIENNGEDLIDINVGFDDLDDDSYIHTLNETIYLCLKNNK